MADGHGRKSVIGVPSAGEQTNLAVLQPVESSDTAAFTPASEKYELAGTLGSGGMGDVLLVRDRDLRREIAMKVLHEDLAAIPDHRVNFISAAQATSQLEHPGIPPVHDVGISPQGEVYFMGSAPQPPPGERSEGPRGAPQLHARPCPAGIINVRTDR